ncbi:GRAM domain [Trinorchestia longiramus]|nr:GRAM domain [Trinorchestia longiramus]
MFRSGSGENITGIVRQMSHPAVRIKEAELDPIKSHYSSSTSLVWKSAENLYQGSCEDDQKRSKSFIVRESGKLPVVDLVQSGAHRNPGSGDSGFPPTASAPSLDLGGGVEMRHEDLPQQDLSDSGSKDRGKKSLSKKSSKSSAKSEKSSKKFGKSGTKKDKKDKKSYSSGDSKANTDTEEQKHQIKTSRSISVNDRVGYETVKDRSTDSGSSTTYSLQYQLLKPNVSRDTSNSSYGGSSLPKSHKSDNLNVSRVSSQSVSSPSSIVGVPTAESTHLSGSSTPVDSRSINSSDHHRSNNAGDHYAPCNKISEESSSPPTSPISLVGNNGWQDAVQRQESLSPNGEAPDRHRYQESSSLSNVEDTSSVRRTSRDISASDTEYLLHPRSDESMKNGHKVVNVMADKTHNEQFSKQENLSTAGNGGEGDGSVAVIQPMFVVNSPSSGDLNASSQNKLRSSSSRSTSPRPANTLSGGESGGDDCSITALKDSMSRSSESTRSTGSQSIVSQKEKSPPQGSEKDKKSKKAWYNVLNPNYKSRSDDLKRLFKNLPLDERLLVDYSCALQKDILVHGRLYVTPNFLSFYSKIFGWETNLMIKFKEVVSMTKEKTALVIPNAIQITTHSDKHFFTTFSARDKAYLMLFRIWQNALMDQQMPAGELWQWVHSSYGDQLGLTSDDDDYIAPSTTEDDQRHGTTTGPPEPFYVASSSGSDKKHSGVTSMSSNPMAVATAGVGASSAGVAAMLLGSDAPASLHTVTVLPRRSCTISHSVPPASGLRPHEVL